MSQLAASLGAVESARVQQARNAIAVRLPSAESERKKDTNGVIGSSAVSHRNRIGDYALIPVDRSTKAREKYRSHELLGRIATANSKTHNSGDTSMRRMNRLRTLSLAVTAALVSACGSGRRRESRTHAGEEAARPSGFAGKPLKARRHRPASLSIELTGDCRAQPDPSMCGSRWMHLRWPHSRPSWRARQASRRRGQLPTASNKAAFAEPLAKYRSELHAQQSKVAISLASVGAEELARVHVAHNAIAVRVDASQLEQIALIPGVAKVRPVINYEMTPVRNRSVRRRRGCAGDRKRRHGRYGRGAGLRHRLHASQSRRSRHARCVCCRVRRGARRPVADDARWPVPDSESGRRLRLRR